MTVNKTLLTSLTKAPESQLSTLMRDKLKIALKGDEDSLKSELHEILDHCARYALASTFVMKILNKEWRTLGGSDDDPTPWRKEILDNEEDDRRINTNKE